MMKTSKSKIAHARRQEIIALAEAVAETHCPARFIDPVYIMVNKDITHSANYYGDGFDGMLEHRSGRFHVYCNLDRVLNLTSPRARFTQGHELGHYFIDEHRNALLAGAPAHYSIADQPDAERIVEQEADLFASHLLMPAARFSLVFSKQPHGLEGIRGIVKEFNVSCASAAIRFVEHSTQPVALAYWRNGKPPWTEVNLAFRNMGLHHLMNRSDLLPPDCATSLAIADNPNVYCEPKVSVSLASFWFNGIYQGSEQDIVIQEEALRLGRFGVLTVLRPRTV